MKQFPPLPGSLGMLLLAVALTPTQAAQATQPAATDQTIFSPGDDATAAYEKIRQAARDRKTASSSFQYACRDFCAKFPDDAHYYDVRRLAVSYWAFYQGGPLRDWDPSEGERDPKLTAEQRADLAMLIANGRALKNFDSRTGSFDDAQFDAVVAALPPHRATKAARDTLIRASLMVAPEKAIPKLREFYPDDAEAMACLRLLESIGKPCEFRFTALDGRKVDSNDYRGQVVVLDFWAKGCAPCVALMPDLKELSERHGPSGLTIVGINMDYNRADADEIIAKFGLTWPQHFDGKGWMSEMAQRFLVTSIPRCAVIDRNGVLRFMANGPTYQNTLERLESLLAEKPAANRATKPAGE
jgi:thiol-disulfide isomerase/thioredoxin